MVKITPLKSFLWALFIHGSWRFPINHIMNFFFSNPLLFPHPARLPWKKKFKKNKNWSLTFSHIYTWIVWVFGGEKCLFRFPHLLGSRNQVFFWLIEILVKRDWFWFFPCFNQKNPFFPPPFFRFFKINIATGVCFHFQYDFLIEKQSFGFFCGVAHAGTGVPYKKKLRFIIWLNQIRN